MKKELTQYQRNLSTRTLERAYRELGQHVYERGTVPASKIIKIQKLRQKLGIDEVSP